MDWTQEVKDSGFNSVLADAAQNAEPSASQDVLLASSTKNDAVDNAFDSRVNGNVPAKEDSFFSGHKDGMKEAQSVFAEDDLDKRFQDALLGNYIPVTGVPDPFSSQLQLNKEASQNTETLAKSNETSNNPFHESSPFRGFEGNSEPVTQGASMEFGYQNENASHASIPRDSNDEEEKKLPASDFDQVHLDKRRRSESVEDENADAPDISQQGILSTNPFSSSDAIAVAEMTGDSPTPELVSSSTTHDRNDGTMPSSEFHFEHLPTETELTSEGGRSEKRSENVGEENAGDFDTSRHGLSNTSPFSSGDVNAEADVTNENLEDKSVLSSTLHTRDDGTLLSGEFHSDHPRTEVELKSENSMTEINPTFNVGFTEAGEPATLEHDTNTSVSLGDSDAVPALVDSMANASVGETKTESPSHNTESLGNTQSSTDVTNEPPSASVGDIAFSEYATESFVPRSTDAGSYHGTNRLLSDTKAFTSEQEPTKDGTESAHSDIESELLGTNSNDAYLGAQQAEFDEGSSYLNLEAMKMEPPKVDVEASDLEEKVSSPSSPQLAGVEPGQIATRKDIIDLVNSNSPQRIADAEDIILKREEHVINSEPRTEDVEKSSNDEISGEGRIPDLVDALASHVQGFYPSAKMTSTGSQGDGIRAATEPTNSNVDDMLIRTNKPEAHLQDSKAAHDEGSSNSNDQMAQINSYEVSDEVSKPEDIFKEESKALDSGMGRSRQNVNGGEMQTNFYHADAQAFLEQEVDEVPTKTTSTDSYGSSLKQDGQDASSNSSRDEDPIFSQGTGGHTSYPVNAVRSHVQDSVFKASDDGVMSASVAIDGKDHNAIQNDDQVDMEAKRSLLEDLDAKPSSEIVHATPSADVAFGTESPLSNDDGMLMRNKRTEDHFEASHMDGDELSFNVKREAMLAESPKRNDQISRTEETADNSIRTLDERMENPVVSENALEIHTNPAQEDAEISLEQDIGEGSADVTPFDAGAKRDFEDSVVNHSDDQLQTKEMPVTSMNSASKESKGMELTDSTGADNIIGPESARSDGDDMLLGTNATKDHTEVQPTALEEFSSNMDVETMRAESHQTDDELLISGEITDEKLGTSLVSNEQFSSRENTEDTSSDPMQTDNEVSSLKAGIEEVPPTTTQKEETDSLNKQIDESLSKDSSRTDAEDIVMKLEDSAFNNEVMVTKFENSVDKEISEEYPIPPSVDALYSDIHDPEFSANFEDTRVQGAAKEVRDSIVKKDDDQVEMVHELAQFEGLEGSRLKPGVNMIPAGSLTEDTEAGAEPVREKVDDDVIEINATETHLQETQTFVDEDSSKLKEEVTHTESRKEVSKPEETIKEDGKTPNTITDKSPIQNFEESFHTHVQDSVYSDSSDGTKNGGETATDVKDSVAGERDDETKIEEERASLEDFVFKENVEMEQTDLVVGNIAVEPEPISAGVHDTLLKINSTKDHSQGPHTDSDEFAPKLNVKMMQAEPNEIYDRVLSHDETSDQQKGTLDEGIEMPSENEEEMHSDHAYAEDQASFKRDIDETSPAGKSTDLEGSSLKLEDQDKTNESRQVENSIFNQDAGVPNNELMISGVEKFISNEALEVPTENPTDASNTHVQSSDVSATFATIGSAGAETGSELSSGKRNDNEVKSEKERILFAERGFNESAKMEPMDSSGMSFKLSTESRRSNIDDMLSGMNATKEHLQEPRTDVGTFSYDMKEESTIFEPPKMYDQAASPKELVDEENRSLSEEGVEKPAQTETVESARTIPTQADAEVSFKQDVHGDAKKHALTDEEDIFSTEDDQETNKKSLHTDVDDSIVKQDANQLEDKPLHMSAEEAIAQEVADDVPIETPTELSLAADQDPVSQVTFDEAKSQAAVTDVEDSTAILNDDQGTVEETRTNLEDLDFNEGENMEHLKLSDVNLEFSTGPASSKIDDILLRTNAIEEQGSQMDVDEFSSNLDNEAMRTEAAKIHDQALPPAKEPADEESRSPLEVGVEKPVLSENTKEIQINPTQRDAQVSFKQDEDSENTALTDSEHTSLTDDYRDISDNSLRTETLESIAKEETIEMGDDQKHPSVEDLIVKGTAYDESVENIDVPSLTHDQDLVLQTRFDDITGQGTVAEVDDSIEQKDDGQEKMETTQTHLEDSNMKQEVRHSNEKTMQTQNEKSMEQVVDDEVPALYPTDEMHAYIEDSSSMTSNDETSNHGKATNVDDPMANQCDDQVQIKEKLEHLEDSDFKEMDMVDTDSQEDIKDSSLIVDAIQDNATSPNEEPFHKSNAEEVPTSTLNEDDENLIANENVKDEYTAPPPFDLHDFTLKSSSAEAEPSQTDALNSTLEQHAGQDHADSSRTESLQENMSEVRTDLTQTDTHDSESFGAIQQPDVEEAVVQRSSELVALEPAREDDVVMMQDIDKLNGELLKMDIKESSTSEYSSNKLDFEPPAPNVAEHPSHSHEDNVVSAQEPAVHLDSNAFGEDSGHPIDDIIIPSEDKAESPGKDALLSDEFIQYPISGEGAAEKEEMARNADDTFHLDDSEGVPAITREDEDHGRAAERQDSIANQNDDQLQIEEQRSYLQEPDFKQSLDMVDIDSAEDVKGSSVTVDTIQDNAIPPNAAAEEPIDKSNVEEMLTPTRNEDDEDLIATESVKDVYTAPPPFDIHDFTLKSSSAEAEPSQTEALNPTLEQHAGQEHADLSRTEVLKDNMSEVSINQPQTDTHDPETISPPLQHHVEEAMVQRSSGLVASEPARKDTDDLVMMQDEDKLSSELLMTDVEESRTSEHSFNKLDFELPLPNDEKHLPHDREEHVLSAQKPAAYEDASTFGEKPNHSIDDIIIPSQDKADPSSKDAALSSKFPKDSISDEGPAAGEEIRRDVDSSFHLDGSEAVHAITSFDDVMNHGTVTAVDDSNASGNDDPLQIEEKRTQLEDLGPKDDMDIVSRDSKGPVKVADDVQDSITTPKPVSDEPIWKSNVDDVLGVTLSEGDDFIAKEKVEEYAVPQPHDIADFTLKSSSDEAHSKPSQTDTLNTGFEQQAGQEHADSSQTEDLNENTPEVKAYQPWTDIPDLDIINAPLKSVVEETVVQRSSELVASEPAREGNDVLVIKESMDTLNSAPLKMDLEDVDLLKHSSDKINFGQTPENVDEHLLQAHDPEEKVVSAQESAVHSDAYNFGEDKTNHIDDIIIPSQDNGELPGIDANISDEPVKDPMFNEGATETERITLDADSSFQLDDSKDVPAYPSFEEAVNRATVAAVEDSDASRNDDQLQIEEQRAQLEELDLKQNMDMVDTDSGEVVKVVDDVQYNVTTPTAVADEPVWKSHVDEMLGDTPNEGDGFIAKENGDEGYAASTPLDNTDFTLKSSSDETHREPSQTDALNPAVKQSADQEHVDSSPTESLNESAPDVSINQPQTGTGDSEIFGASLQPDVEQAIVYRSSELVASEPAREDDDVVFMKQHIDTLNSKPLKTEVEDLSALKHSSDQLDFEQPPPNIVEQPSYDHEEKVVSAQEPSVHADTNIFGQDQTRHLDDMVIPWQNESESPGNNSALSDELLKDLIPEESAAESEVMTQNSDGTLHLDGSESVPAVTSFDETMDLRRATSVEDSTGNQSDDQLQVEEQQAPMDDLGFKQNMNMDDTDSVEDVKGSPLLVNAVQDNASPPKVDSEEPIYKSNAMEEFIDTLNEKDEATIAKESMEDHYAAPPPLDAADFKSDSDGAHSEPSQQDTLNATFEHRTGQEHAHSSQTETLKENIPKVETNQPQMNIRDSQTSNVPLHPEVEEPVVQHSSELVASEPTRNDDDDVVMKQSMDALNSKPSKTDLEDVGSLGHDSDNLNLQRPPSNVDEHPSQAHVFEEAVLSAQEPALHLDTNTFGEKLAHPIDDIIIPREGKSESLVNDAALSDELLKDPTSDKGATESERMTKDADSHPGHLPDSECLPAHTNATSTDVSFAGKEEIDDNTQELFNANDLGDDDLKNYGVSDGKYDMEHIGKDIKPEIESHVVKHQLNESTSQPERDELSQSLGQSIAPSWSGQIVTEDMPSEGWTSDNDYYEEFRLHSADQDSAAHQQSSKPWQQPTNLGQQPSEVAETKHVSDTAPSVETEPQNRPEGVEDVVSVTTRMKTLEAERGHVVMTDVSSLLDAVSIGRPESSAFGTPPEDMPLNYSDATSPQQTDADPRKEIGSPNAYARSGDIELEKGRVTPETLAADSLEEQDAEFDEGPEMEYDEAIGESDWRMCVVGGKEQKIDMKIIEPYTQVLSHGGYMEGDSGQTIIVFAACHLPERGRSDYAYVMDNLFLYVLTTLDELVSEEYVLVYLHGGATSASSPTFSWLRRAYQLVDHRFRKTLKGLYLVHPSFWLRTIVALTRPFISSKFSRKLRYVDGLRELSDLIPMNHVMIPEEVKQVDFQVMIAERKKELNIK